MAAPSADWIAGQQASERAFAERYAKLDALLSRVDGYVQRAEGAAASLAKMPNGNPAERKQEAADWRQLATIARHHLANLDRVHLLEEPARRKRAGGGR